MNKEEIKKKIKNIKIRGYFDEFENLSGLALKFNHSPRSRCSATHRYKHGSSDFEIDLNDSWNQRDVAHELIHGKIMFLDRYGIIICDHDVCQLVRDYIEDVVVHSKMNEEFGIRPYSQQYLDDKQTWSINLFKGGCINDTYWDPKGDMCKHLHKTLLYVQAWHFSLFNFGCEEKLRIFLRAFEMAYSGKEELKWAKKIINICENNNYFKTINDYEKGIKEISNLISQTIPIRYFCKSGRGYIFTE